MSWGNIGGSESIRWIFRWATLATFGLLLQALLLPNLPIALHASAQERESIFDRTVHLEPALITEIPHVPRLEDSLGIEGRRVNIGDAELWVEEEGNGIALILINGGPGGTHHMFHPWFGEAAKFARVIYYDQRGCGLSEYAPGPDGYSVPQAAADLEALRKALGLDTVVLAGFSYGGFLAQYYTAHYPENVAGLVLVGAAPGIRADLGESRERDFMSEEEIEKKKEILADFREIALRGERSEAEILALLVYNNFLNGDWKRQHYYKPSREEIARIALYEWVQDSNFNGAVGQSMGGIDFTGAFDANPIPTLIMEGEWDLTWGPEKKAAIAANHPNGKLITVEKAGHSIFNENTEAFFSTLQGFIQALTPPETEALAAFQDGLQGFREAWIAARAAQPRPLDWGLDASRHMAEGFGPGWAEAMQSRTDYLRLGFALYDTERYEEALEVFRGFESWSRVEGDTTSTALAAIWQGHMLDLLGRHGEAIPIYQSIADLGIEDSWSHGQYGLRYALSPWAKERIETPFEKIENRSR